MTKLLVLSAADIAQLFTMEDALRAVEDAYRQKATGEGVAWPMVYEQFTPDVADMDIRSGELAGSNAFGLKLTAWFSENSARNLPEIFGTTLLCNNETGAPLALLNASAITGLRTGAAAGLGAKWLARKDAAQLLIAGSGHMCAFVIAGILAACPSVTTVEVWNPHSADAPITAVKRIRGEVEQILAAYEHGRSADSFAISAVADGATAAAKADIIATATPATQPVLMRSWVRPGTHISCVGADMPGKQELENALVSAARVFVDDRAQSLSAGELEIPVMQGAMHAEDIVAELGEVIAGTNSGRANASDITVFDTSGIAVQDLAAANTVYHKALEAELGTPVEL